MSAQEQVPEGEASNNGEQLASLKNLVEQLQLELSNTKSELEFSKAENSNLQKQNEASQEAIASLQRQVQAVVGQVDSKQKELADHKKEADSLTNSRKLLLEENASTKEELERVKA